jgi:hypothetical protein
MAYVKRIVCLANSFKKGGTCVAGKELREEGYGGWVRPVSMRATAELWPSEAQYANCGSPRVLDIIDVPLIGAAPLRHQTENFLIDDTGRWNKVGEVSGAALARACDDPASLWMSREHTAAGCCDCMSPVEAARVRESLFLIRPEQFVIEVRRDSRTQRKGYRRKFRYKGTQYNLSMTDPVVRGVYVAKEEGDYPVDAAYVCVSLTEPFRDRRCYKLVASVISSKRVRA